jgi:DNA-binding response OmpR family regulator
MSVDRREQRASRGTRRAGEAVMRRRQPAESAAETGATVAGQLEFRPSLFQAFVSDASPDLTRGEFELLEMLRPQRVG